MPSYNQIVDQIRGFVQSSDQTRNDRLTALASDYADACLEVNQRLGRCHRLLQQGLRSEAIQLANADPLLLDAVAALDFPERADWDELTGIYGLASAPRLAMETAEFLNQAYAEEEPLQDLLRTHRRLALERSPLKNRISVMRLLAARDPNNLIWIDDLRTFEKARFRQIHAEALEALQHQNGSEVSKRLAELQEQTWIEPPPRSLLQALTKADAQVRGQQTRAALADLETRLSDAFAARDPIRARMARAEWNQLTANQPRVAGDPIWDRVAPALQWLEEEDRRDQANQAYQEALNDLIDALDNPEYIPPAELDRLLHAVLQFGHGIPASLQQRLASRLASAESTRSRRIVLIAVPAAAAMLLVGGVMFILVRNNARSGYATEAALAITDRLELGQLEQAGGILAKLDKDDPALLGYPALIDARQRYEASQKVENDRSLQFEKAMRDADSAPLHQPDPPALATARSLARLETEKQAISRLVERRQSALQAERTKHETTLKPRLDTISRQIYKIEQSLAASPIDETQILGAIEEARQGLVESASQLAAAGADLQALGRVLEQKIEAARNGLDRAHRRDRSLVEITESVDFASTNQNAILARFANRLQAFITAYPDDPRSRAFTETLKDQRLWLAIDAWNELVSNGNNSLESMSPEQARIRAEECRKFATQHPVFPDLDDLDKYRKYVEAISNRSADAEAPATRIARLLSDILVDQVYLLVVTVRNPAGGVVKKRYYATKKPVDNEKFVTFDSIVSFDGKEVTRTISSDRISYNHLSPQSEIASRFKPRISNQTSQDQWESVMIELVSAIVKQPEIEPILQVALLKKVIEVAGEGSESLRESFQSIKKTLEDFPVDVNVLWMDPDTPNLDRVRKQAEGLVQTVGKLTPTVKAISELRDQLNRSVARKYRSIGWLTMEQDSWKIATGSVAPPGQQELWVITLLSGNRGAWKKVGIMSAGQPIINTRDSSILAEGRPVFLMVKPLS